MDDQVAHAISYPFERPEHSFVFHPASGAAVLLGPDEIDGTEGRIPVLAVGSNAAPSQLAKKFPATGEDDDPIPVVRVIAHGIDVVYAARVSRYGAVPGTPYRTPDVAAQLHVTLLTDSQLDRMNASEGLGVGYELVELPDVVLDPPVLASGPLLSYSARAGALNVEGQPVALEAISATGRTLLSWSQNQMLEHVAALQGLEIESFVSRVLTEEGYQALANRALRGHRSSGLASASGDTGDADAGS